MGRAIGLFLIFLGLAGLGATQIDWPAASKLWVSWTAGDVETTDDAVAAAETEPVAASSEADDVASKAADDLDEAAAQKEEAGTTAVTELKAGDIKVFDTGNPASPDELPWVDIAAGNDSFSEDSDHVSFILTLSEPVERPIIIIFSTVDGSARSEEDYLSQRGTVTFKPGMVSAEIRTPLVDDEVKEGDEQFAMVLNGAPSIVKLKSQRIKATIKDND